MARHLSLRGELKLSHVVNLMNQTNEIDLGKGKRFSARSDSSAEDKESPVSSVNAASEGLKSLKLDE